MDYKAFFADCGEWINQVNQQAATLGMESDAFWSWVTRSMAEIGKKYGNADLVVKQMTMLYDWLEGVYAEGRRGR